MTMMTSICDASILVLSARRSNIMAGFRLRSSGSHFSYIGNSIGTNALLGGDTGSGL
jgi:hypothetical protein